MTQSDRLEVARSAVETHGQAEVAKRIGRSSSAVSLVLAGKYAGNPDKILERIVAEFSNETVNCPILGEIALADCLEARQRAELPFFPSSGQTTELYQTCPTCKYNGGKS
ncbi:MAG: hypothetical protein L3J57_14805 [Desulfuromusa sp.]|nr:hypothetical protein [Desulfuromusa sp.]